METEQELKGKDVDPTNDIGYAASNGTAPEHPLHEYADLKFRIVGNPGALFGALAGAQQEYPPLEKTANVKYWSKKINGYIDYDYSPIEEILAKCRPPLNKNGLAVTQPLSMTERGNHVVITILGHKSGAYMMMEARVPMQQDPKDTAGLITYFRRYTLQAVLGVAGEESEEAAVAEAEQTKGFDTADKRAPAGGKVELLATPRNGEEFTDTQRKHLEAHGLKRADDQDTEVWTATAGAGRAAHIESKLKYAVVQTEKEVKARE